LASVKNKEFRYFSPEIHWNVRDEKGKAIGTQLKAGAITNRPFLKDLPPIEIDPSQYSELVQSAAMSESRRMTDPAQVHVPTLVNNPKESPDHDSKAEIQKARRWREQGKDRLLR
jgi:hypothetical protein